MSQPANLPHDWEYQPETNSVICGGCAFRYGAEHPDGDGNWTCPNCGAGNGSLEQKQAYPSAEYERLQSDAKSRERKALLDRISEQEATSTAEK